jgi:hypothetical protein
VGDKTWENDLRSILNNLETILTDGIAAIGPWLTPIPSAALVAQATVEHLGWSRGLGWVTAAIIESLGITTVNTALTLWNYNQTRRKTDEAAPFLLAAALALVYLASTIGLTVLLDIVPDLARFAPALFPLLAMVGAVTLALRAGHKHRLQAIQAAKAERQAIRSTWTIPDRSGWVNPAGQVNGAVNGQIHPPQPNPAVKSDGPSQANQFRKTTRQQALKDLVALYRSRPGASYSTAGQAVGRSKAWVAGAVNELLISGQLRHTARGIEATEESARSWS